ncbi:nuclease-related domain-containing protein [Mycetocola saprophilus]|uniref:nuclease-related domain-containing protein n=1 Tax=Mycetocola saprophilus TaxID=76636 RepID=UPI003BEFEA50
MFYPWLATALAIALIAVISITVRNRRKTRHQLAEQFAAHGHHVEMLQTTAAEVSRSVDFRFSQLEQQHVSELEAIRSWASTGLRWEATSRELILRAVRDDHLNGFLATNICILAHDPHTGKPHITQIDHLLVTDQSVLIIESKYWDGLIIHSKKGKASSARLGLEQLSALRPLPADETYVVCVYADKRPLIQHAQAGVEPARQARQQAKRLSEALLQHTQFADLPFIKTCVFYSHPNGVLASDDRTIDGTLITNAEGLSSAIRSAKSTQSNTHIDALGAWATAAGADVVGFGSFEQTWQSHFPTGR